MLNIINENGRKVLKMDAKVFIIPNSLVKVSDYLVESTKKRVSEFASKVCKINDIERFNPDEDSLVQLWFHCEESDNICCHGIRVMDGDEKTYLRPTAIENLPCKIFHGKKEGDTFMLKVPCDDVMIEMNLTLDQLDYRYPQHGGFDETLSYLESYS